MLTKSKEFTDFYPSAHAGILIVRDVQNPADHPKLEERKREIEKDLRIRFSMVETQLLTATPPLPAYAAYYKRFDKTYHVLGQLSSVIYKEKPIPSVSTLVEAMFMAELKNGMLTSGHDLNQIQLPLLLNVSTGEEHYTVMCGQDQVLKDSDMYIADQEGILSSILYGPDQRTRITLDTHNVLFTVYAPEGVNPEDVENHMKELHDLMLIVSPKAEVDLLQVI